MILKNNQDEILQIGDFNSIEMGIDLNDTSKIMYILSQGLYQRPRHSIVAEYTSNAIDSMIDAGKDYLEKPCIIGLDNKKIWFKDFGEGVSPERMVNIISKFGASTKDKSNKTQGVFGLGIKSAFAYTSQFTLESNYEGVKRTWLFTKNGTVFEITPMSETEVEEENSTTIIIPINDDVSQWKNAILEIVPYFKGVMVEHPDFEEFNKTKLYESKYFYYRQRNQLNGFHIVLDQVIYEIYLPDIGLSTIDFPFGVKFGLDEGLIPTPAKDKILLTDDTKELIRERLKSVVLELNELVYTKKCNLYQYLSKNNRVYTFSIGEDFVHVDKSQYDKLCHQLKADEPNVEYIPINENLKLIPRLNLEFLYKSYREVGRLDWKSRFSKKNENGTLYNFNGKIIVVDEVLNGSKIEFLRSLNLGTTTFVRFSRSDITLNMYKNYNGLGIGIKDYNNKLQVPKEKWRDCIIAWQQEEDEVLNSFPKLSDYRQQYQDWLKNKPKKIRTNSLGIKEDDDITVRFPALFDVRNSDFNMKFEPKFVKVSSLNKKFYIYSTERKEVDNLYDLWRNQKNIIPIMVNKTEIYKIRDLKNCISYEEFAKGRTRYAQKWVTAWLIYQDIVKDKLLKKLFYKSYDNEFKYIDKISDFELLQSINRNTNTSTHNRSKSFIQGEINTIIKYLNSWNSHCQDSTFVESVVETYTKLGLVDIPVLKQWESLKKKLSYYDALLYLKEDKQSYKFVDEILLLKKKNEMYQRQVNKLKQELNNCKSNNNG